MNNILEVIKIWWNYKISCLPIYQFIKKVIYFIFKHLQSAIKILIGAISGHILQTYLNKIDELEEFEFSVISSFLSEKIIYFFVLMALIAILIYLNRVKKERNQIVDRINLLNLSLRWFFEDLGFDEFPIEKKTEYDLRCTLWSPVRYSNDSRKMVIEQIADYYPFVSISPSIHGNKVYKSNGRRRKVTRIDKNGDLLPVGLVGKTVFDALSNHEPAPQVGYVEQEADFIKEMVDVWKFLPYEAKKLTDDRRSYYCYPIMTQTYDDILALLYIDSKKPHAFTDESGKDVMLDRKILNRYIIRISKLVQKDQKLSLGSSESE